MVTSDVEALGDRPAAIGNSVAARQVAKSGQIPALGVEEVVHAFGPFEPGERVRRIVVSLSISPDGTLPTIFGPNQIGLFVTALRPATAAIARNGRSLVGNGLVNGLVYMGGALSTALPSMVFELPVCWVATESERWLSALFVSDILTDVSQAISSWIDTDLSGVV